MPTLPAEVIERFENMGAAIQGLTMVPLSDMFERFRKMVLDLSRELDKPIDDLVVTGDDIDKYLLSTYVVVDFTFDSYANNSGPSFD